jgi:hypothetical protein
MKVIQISPNLHLVQQPISIDQATTKQERLPTQHLWIFDRSYSMYDELPTVGEHMIEQSRKIPKGDTLSLGYFSGEGEYNWIFKGRQLNSDADYVAIEKIIRSNIRAIGTTCFSEILATVPQVIADLEPFGDRFSLAFLTDGNPVVRRRVSEEMADVRRYLGQISGKVVAALFVGYGPFYSRENLAAMTASVSGSFLHADRLAEFNMALGRLVETAEGVEKKHRFELMAQPEFGIALTIQNKQPNLLNIIDGDYVAFTPTRDNEDSIFYITALPPIGVEQFDLSDALGAKKSEDLFRGIYGAAKILNQAGRTDVALEMMAKLGDIAIVKKLDSSYTNKELGDAENFIQQCIEYSGKRFTEGFKPNSMPAADAFCLMNVLSTLIGDPQAFFYPKHEEFKYKRIGKPSLVVDGMPKFTYDPTTRASISDIGWNEELLNLSIANVVLHGTVELQGTDRELKRLGFKRNYPAIQFRQYTLVLDGNIWTEKFPISCSETTFNYLQENGVIDSGQKWRKDKVFVLNLSGLKIINRKIAEQQSDSAVDLCRLIAADLEDKGVLKALKYLLNEIDPDKSLTTTQSLSAEQIEFLEKNYIFDGQFKPLKKEGEVTDFYMARTFTIKAKGYSGYSPVKKVNEAIAAGKKLNGPDTAIKKGLAMFEIVEPQLPSPTLQAHWLKQAIADTKSRQTLRRNSIAETKLALLLNHKNFKDVNIRAEGGGKIDVDGITFTIDVNEKKVNF